jgi:DNA-binding MurR/RpiR family transcriptional regulator
MQADGQPSRAVISVADRIRRHLDQLSPNDRRIAHHLLDHPAQAPFETAESLAAHAGVSKAAVVRFAVRVGFAGFGELHEALRAEAVERLSGVRSVEPAAAEGVLPRWIERAQSDLSSLAAGVDQAAFDSAVALLRRGNGKIGIFGHRKSAALAEYAYYLLNPLLSNVWPIAAGEPGIADQLIDLEPGDRLIAFTFRRYARITAQVVSSFQEAGAPVVLVTDDPMAPAADLATHLLVCSPAQPGEFDTAAPGIVLIEALAASIAARSRTGAKRRDLAERLWKQFGTY